MDIKYKILWIEDQEDWAESIESSLKEVIEEQYGFSYDMTLNQHFDAKTNYKEYDLILMDFKLSDGNTGDKIIQQIRNLDVLTDVVFYSADGPKTLKQKAAEKELEGVYFSDRDNYQFIEKVSKVIESTIRKTQDLNFMRGLVMAEVSELDSMMDSIILDYYSDADKMEIFHQNVTKDREKSLRKKLKDGTSCDKTCTLVWRDKSIDEIINEIESSQRAAAISAMLKKIDANGNFYEKDKFRTDYNEEIIPLRNQLAHCQSILTENGEEVLKTKKGDRTFSFEDFKTIRLNIRKYKELFEKLIGEINSTVN